MSTNSRKTVLPTAWLATLGYQPKSNGTDPQLDELRAAGGDIVREEHASGAERSRPVLARPPRDIRPGEMLVVVRLDWLVRSATCSPSLSNSRPVLRISGIIAQTHQVNVLA
jgi:DNA invertase Pin-like site-specific DNA recombinase